MSGLSAKQQAFIAAYIGVAHYNATEAARIAGYKSPRIQGSENLTKPDIRAAIDEHLAEVKAQGIALRHNRIAEQMARHEALKTVVAERSAHPEMEGIPGGATGFVVKELKSVKHVYEPDPEDHEGKARQVAVEVWESSIDAALLKEFREIEKQVAIERGEWTEKREVSGPDGGAIPIVAIEVTRPAGDGA